MNMLSLRPRSIGVLLLTLAMGAPLGASAQSLEVQPVSTIRTLVGAQTIRTLDNAASARVLDPAVAQIGTDGSNRLVLTAVAPGRLARMAG